MVETPALSNLPSPAAQPSGSVGGPPRRQRPVFYVIFGLGLIIALYVSKLFAFFSAAPILYFTLSQGSVAGGLLWALSTAAVAWINPLDAFYLMICTGFACWIAGILIRKGRRLDEVMMVSVVSTALLVGGGYLLLKNSGVMERSTLVHQIRGDLRDNLNLFYHEVKKVDEAETSLFTPNEERETKRQFFENWAMALVPGGLVASTALALWIFLIFLRKSADNLGFGETYANLSRWRSPDVLVWMVVIVLSALVFRLEASKTFCANLLIVLGTVYLFQGLAVLVHSLQRTVVPPTVRLLCYVAAIIFFQYVALILIAVGFFDVWFDFRKLKVGVL